MVADVATAGALPPKERPLDRKLNRGRQWFESYASMPTGIGGMGASSRPNLENAGGRFITTTFFGYENKSQSIFPFDGPAR